LLDHVEFGCLLLLLAGFAQVIVFEPMYDSYAGMAQQVSKVVSSAGAHWCIAACSSSCASTTQQEACGVSMQAWVSAAGSVGGWQACAAAFFTQKQTCTRHLIPL
jgi:hypothetical protein